MPPGFFQRLVLSSTGRGALDDAKVAWSSKERQGESRLCVLYYVPKVRLVPVGHRYLDFTWGSTDMMTCPRVMYQSL